MSSAHINLDLRNSAEEMLRGEWEEAKSLEITDPVSIETAFRKSGATTITHSSGEILLEAARFDLLNVVTFCLRSVPADYRSRLGDTALHCAAKGGHVRMCKHFIQLGVGANSGNRLGETPLMCASEWGQVAAAQFLLTVSAAEAVSEFGQTALHIAAREGRAEVCEAILKANRNIVNWKDQSEQTALGYVAEQGFVEAMKVIEKYGGKPA